MVVCRAGGGHWLLMEGLVAQWYVQQVCASMPDPAVKEAVCLTSKPCVF
jgi:hypothetical protein